MKRYPKGKEGLYVYITPDCRKKLDKLVRSFQEDEEFCVSLSFAVEKVIREYWTYSNLNFDAFVALLGSKFSPLVDRLIARRKQLEMPYLEKEN